MNSKYNKYYDFSSSLALGVIFIIFGVILFIGRDKLYRDIVSVLVFILLLISIFDFVKYLSKYRDCNENSRSLFSFIVTFICLILFIMIPNIPFGFLPFIFAVYLFLIGIVNFVMYLLLYYSKSNNKLVYLFISFIYFFIGIPVIMRPIRNVNTFIICLSIYLILFGITYIFDFVVNILSVRTIYRIKRRIRITLPKLFEVFIPYSVMIEINNMLSVDRKYNYKIKKGNNKADLYVLIHTSIKSANRVGHIDIYYNGNVISYGNYDEGSRKFNELFGDGVIFFTKRKSDYINFCIDNSKKTIFEYGIMLNDRQKMDINNRLNDIMSNTYSWDYKCDKLYNNGNSYAAKLYKKTCAKFYKFNSGKYKIYFVLGTNCCYLADDIIGKSGSDILSINGIITPGTYYDYLEKELRKKNSNVISKEIYNFDKKSKKSIKSLFNL